MKNKVAVVIATLFISLIPNAASANHVSACYLPAGNDANHQRVGWPRDPNVLDSMGTSKIIVIPVDFTDAVSNRNTIGDLERRLELRNVSIFYDVVSSSKFQTNFVVIKEITRINNPSYIYGNSPEQDLWTNGDFASHMLTRDALLAFQIANPTADLTQYDAAIIVVTGGASLSGRVAVASSNDEDTYGLLPGRIHNSILVGLGALSVEGVHPGRMIAHEINHLLGLVDLYLYAPDGYWQGKSPGPFGQQGYIRGVPSSDSLAYNRWLRGWVPDERVLCLPTIDANKSFTLSPRGSTAGQYEMAIYRISQEKVLVLESPKELGFGSKTFPRTILVYTVDSRIKPGEGPIRLVAKKDAITTAPLSPDLPDWERYKTAALKSGESVEFGSMVIFNRTRVNSGTKVNASILIGNDAIRKTIICLQKTKKIKVSGYLPTCPAGFRKI